MTAAGPIRIAVIGTGKIARDQHLPAIAVDPDFELSATVGPDVPTRHSVPHFKTLDALLRDGPVVDAVAVCTPPQVRHPLARAALARGLHVLLEKPPGVTLGEIAALEAQALAAGRTLFASWHSRFAAGVAPARTWFAQREIRAATIVWREDVRVWHPGQAWIWQPGGLGVFDPGINALSIVSAILPGPIRLAGSTLSFPTNRHAPIAAALTVETGSGAPIMMDLDWWQQGPQSWDITVETDAGVLRLSHGGATLTLPSGTTQGRIANMPASTPTSPDLSGTVSATSTVIRYGWSSTHFL